MSISPDRSLKNQQALVTGATSGTGRDVLVNNAGFSVFGATAELGVEQFAALFASNVRAPFLLVAALAPDGGQRQREASSASAAWRARSVSRGPLRTARRKPPRRR